MLSLVEHEKKIITSGTGNYEVDKAATLLISLVRVFTIVIPPAVSMTRSYRVQSPSSDFRIPYKFYVLGQIGHSKQCRPRSDCF